MIALDLFAGTGWGVACQRLGIEEIGVEIMPEARATREANGMHTPFADVWDVLLNTPIDSPEFDAALQIASPPCQTFSMAGGGAGRRALDEVLGLIDARAYLSPEKLHAFGESHDPRTALVLTPLAMVARHAPTYVVWEQVPPVLPVWERAAVEMRKWGYSVWTGVVSAEQYGVPQTRKRAILIARWDGKEATPPKPTHNAYNPRAADGGRFADESLLPWVSMADALGWGMTERPSPTITGGGTETGGAEPIAKLTRYVGRPDWRSRPDALVESVPGRSPEWVFHRPAPTVVGAFAPDVVAAPGYRRPGDGPRQKAPGSVRVLPHEAAILQSYAPDFPFQGAKGKRFLQIGNAVPPLLAEAILKAAIS